MQSSVQSSLYVKENEVLCGSISLCVPLRAIKFISRTPKGNKVH